MLEYKVKVYADGDKFWYLNNKLHCEHGPAYENNGGYNDGYKAWYLNGKELTEAEFNKRMSKPCNAKVVEVDGVKYKLVEV